MDFLDKMASKRFNVQHTRWIAKKYLTPGKLLDLGCGKGYCMETFSKFGFDVRGCDIRPVNKKIDKVDLEKEKLPYPDGCFDYVYAKHVIEHLQSPDNLLSEVWRVLKPGGRLLLFTPDYEQCGDKFYAVDPTHIKPYTKEKLKNLLIKNNFEVLTVEDQRNLPFLWRYTTLAFDIYFPLLKDASIFLIAKKKAK